MARIKSLLEVEWSRVRIREGCWEWVGAKDKFGYGQMAIDCKKYKSHRITYQWLIGPIPEGLELDHLCRNPNCCNPIHLEPVTHQKNMVRGNAGKWQRDKTHCKHGHEFTEENTKVENGHRRCIACAKTITASRREAHKACDRRYYMENKDKIRAQQKVYYDRTQGVR